MKTEKKLKLRGKSCLEACSCFVSFFLPGFSGMQSSLCCAATTRQRNSNYSAKSVTSPASFFFGIISHCQEQSQSCGLVFVRLLGELKGILQHVNKSIRGASLLYSARVAGSQDTSTIRISVS